VVRAVLLVVIDGFAFGKSGHICNAVEIAKTPTFDRLRQGPWTEVQNFGPDVGLPPGQMGNSEVGHMTIGAGRLVPQDLMRIDADAAAGSLGSGPEPQKVLEHLRKTGGRLHLMGLLGSGGVHAVDRHWHAAAMWAKENHVEVYLHPIADGRDTPPKSAAPFLDDLTKTGAPIASLVGRYYAMDRDNRWERIQSAYELYTQGNGHRAATAEDALQQAYGRGETDEFVTSTIIDPNGVIQSGDAVWWLNFRPDRSRQMTRAFMDPQFPEFSRPQVENLQWLCMTQYDAAFAKYPNLAIAYSQRPVPGTLAEYLSKMGLKQFHIAETEKYAHVTYFFNGGIEQAWPGEERVLIASPKVATYDLQPRMSAGEITDRLLEAMGSGGHDFYVVNFANPDMVGHTGKLSATVEAVEFVDNCINRLVAVAQGLGIVTVITSDHGNAEEMCVVRPDETKGEPITKHTLYPSPVLVYGADVQLAAGGTLANVAPTILQLMGLDIPAEMTTSLLVAAAKPSG